MSSTDPLERSSGLIRSGDLSAAGAIAQGLLAQGRFSEAEAVFRQLCAADPANARGWLGLGRALDRQKKPAEASDAFQRACDLAPDSGEAQRLLGACKLRDGATLEALRCFERAVAAEPANAMHHAALANAYQQLNDHRATLTHFARAVELAPQSAPLFSTYLFELSHHPELSPEHVFAEHVRYGKTCGRYVRVSRVAGKQRLIPSACLDAKRCEPLACRARIADAHREHTRCSGLHEPRR
jgi:protein O-GlcNAc transferase